MIYDHVGGEVVITATEFKAKCLELLDRVKSGSLKKVRITKRGREVGLLTGPESAVEEPWDPYSMFGAMKGQFIIPEEIDLTKPIYDPARDGECDPVTGLYEMPAGFGDR